MARVKIYGLDFTSVPSGRMPLVAVGCTLNGRVLRVESTEVLGGFEGFEGFLESGGPWDCGMDFPFGQPRTLVEGLGSKKTEEAYGFVVRMADALDLVLCAVQAAWAYTKRDEGWGVPGECDRDEGWILDPQLLAKDG